MEGGKSGDRHAVRQGMPRQAMRRNSVDWRHLLSSGGGQALGTTRRGASLRGGDEALAGMEMIPRRGDQPATGTPSSFVTACPWGWLTTARAGKRFCPAWCSGRSVLFLTSSLFFRPQIYGHGRSESPSVRTRSEIMPRNC